MERRPGMAQKYASRIYRRPDHPPTDWRALIALGTPPCGKRSGVIFPVEGGYWMVTLAGWLRDYPPDDDVGFLEYARSLSQPEVYDAIKEAEPVTPIKVYKYSANRWRRYERMPRLPEGFIIIGDAVCAFSPVYGQGMSVAAIEAKTLDGCLREQENWTGNANAASFRGASSTRLPEKSRRPGCYQQEQTCATPKPKDADRWRYAFSTGTSAGWLV